MSAALTLGDLSPQALDAALRGPGLRLRTGPWVFAIRSRLPQLLTALPALYGRHPLADDNTFADFHVEVIRATGLRRYIRPQIYFGIGGESPFSPLPADQGVPILEWGMNWCITGHAHHLLVLHAAVLERNGRALILPAPSGSGKSTLCAALLLRGWRLLSDELALIDPATGQLLPFPRAVSLKNASIEVIQAFGGDQLQFASVVRDTVKGTVGHFAPPPDAVERGDERAGPGWIVFPKYVAGSAASLSPMTRGQAMIGLIENAFNYNLLHRTGFQTMANLVQASTCRRFQYSRLDEAVQLFDELSCLPPGAA